MGRRDTARTVGTEAERVRRFRERQNAVKIPRTKSGEIKRAHPRLWSRARDDFLFFCERFIPGTFYLPWSDFHQTAAARIVQAIRHGAMFAMALPRGSGKSALCRAACIWAALYGHRRYIMLIAATESKAVSQLRELKHVLRMDGDFRETYPEIGLPAKFRNLGHRAPQLIIDGRDGGMEWTTTRVILPAVEGSLAASNIIEVAGLTGDILGRSHTTPAGEAIRPDFVLIDDPQTAESANSASQCDFREKVIRADVLGLAGPGVQISAVMPCTIKRRGDLSDRFLDTEQNPDWRGLCLSMLSAMPDRMDLWDEYNAIRTTELARDAITYPEATAFYEAHRDEMDAGSVPSWPERVADSDVSALQTAMNLYYRLGPDAFLSEYQNDPPKRSTMLYEITADMVAGNMSGYARRDAPTGAPFIVGMIDINRIGLHWCVAASTNDLALYVLDYGKYPPGDDAPLWEEGRTDGEHEIKKIVQGLNALVPLLALDTQWTRGGERARLNTLFVDCGYAMRAVFRFCEGNRWPVELLPARGRDAKRYRQVRMIGKPGDRAHMTEFRGLGRVVVHDADYWRVHAQKAFLLAPGTPGGMCVFGQHGTRERTHAKFGRHIASEQLLEYVRGDQYDHYVWHLPPGENNDLLDCAVGCCVAANRLGASVENTARPGNVVKRARKRKAQYMYA